MSAETVSMGILHAPSDKGFLQALLNQLAPAVRSQRVTLWHHGQLTLGGDIREEVASRLQQFGLIVPLLTPRFLAEHHDWLDLALAERTRGARVVPVLCRSVLIEGSPFAGVSILPGTQAIADVRDRDKVWTAVAGKLLTLIDELNRQPAPLKTLSAQAPSPPPALQLRVPLSAQKDRIHDRLRVLFMGANPRDATPVDSLREVAQIDKKLTTKRHGSDIDLIQKWGVDVSDLADLLLAHHPHILHFSGHGTKAGKLVMEDGVGNGVEVPPKAFAELLGILNDQRSLKCVVLSACYTADQAQALAEHVPCVIGIAKTISNDTAAAFAAGFYGALAAGESFQKSFDIGRAQIKLLSQRKTSLRLYVMPGVDANTLWLTT